MITKLEELIIEIDNGRKILEYLLSHFLAKRTPLENRSLRKMAPQVHYQSKGLLL